MRYVALAALTLCLVLPGCASRGTITVLPEAAATGSTVEILVATTRGATESASIASRGRSETVRWGAFEISVPPDRSPGTVTFPSGPEPDPATDFLTVSARQYADEQASSLR
jgi:esterase/lipase superfamily enzyme